MPTYPEIQAAVPPDGVGQVGKTLLRDAITNRTAYVLGDAESLGDLFCVDPATGATILVVVYKGRLFWYDETDSSTSDDGITCLVSAEARRYKLSDGADVFAYSVLSKSLSAPPVSPTPSIGDAYLIAAAATGDWAGKSDFVGVWTARGPDWEYIDFGVGRLIYVEDLDAYYHRDSGGAWVSGFGNLVIGVNSVPMSAAINFGRRVIVENSTTTAPPGTAAVGVAFRIGAGATGTWSGHDDDIAICEVTNTFTIYDPSNGWLIFDKNTGTEYRYNGTAWVSASGSWVDRKSVPTTSGSTTAPSGTTSYTYSSGTAPTTSQRRLIDTATITHTAKKTGAVLRFDYTADTIFATGSTILGTKRPVVIALFRDSVVNAVAWKVVQGFTPDIIEMNAALGAPTTLNLAGAIREFFEYAAPDTSSHTYTIAIISGGTTGAAVDAGSLTRRLFTLQEAA